MYQYKNSWGVLDTSNVQNECIAYQLKPLGINFSSIKFGDNMFHKYMYCFQLVPSFAIISNWK